MKGSINQEDITGKYLELKIQSHKLIKQMLTDLKGDIDNNATIVGDLNALSTMDRSSR